MSGYYEIIARTKIAPEDIIPLDVIRVHAKIDDVPSVTDAQLELYRLTALEQAEKYTNRIIDGQATVIEEHSVDISEHGFSRRRNKVKLKYSPNSPEVFIKGVTGGSRQHARTRPNSRQVELPSDGWDANIGNCCLGKGLTIEAKIQYTTGYLEKELIPSTIIYGCLKFIAWAVSNPGDELLTVRNRLGTTETGLIGTNSGAWASGAIEHWMTYQVK